MSERKYIALSIKHSPYWGGWWFWGNKTDGITKDDE